MENKELIEKTAEAKKAHEEFLRRCAKDLDLIEKCYEEVKAGLVNTYCPSIKAVLALSIPIIQKAERERMVDRCFDYFSEIVRADKVIVNLLDQLEIMRQVLKGEAD